MSDMVKRYEETKAPRPAAAKEIPDNPVNFIDQQNEFQDGFVPNEKKGDPTKFTDKAQQYYSTEVKNITLPDNFQPTEQGITLHRYTPENKYYNPGAPK